MDSRNVRRSTAVNEYSACAVTRFTGIPARSAFVCVCRYTGSPKFPSAGLVYDYWFDKDSRSWKGWMELDAKVTNFKVDTKASFADIIVRNSQPFFVCLFACLFVESA